MRPVADLEYTSDEIMTVSAARELADRSVCFVGIGLPSTAANLARRTHAPHIVLIYESGCIGAKPDRLPRSIGDGVLAETATAVVSVPEIFTYWLQAGRVDIGFLGAAQVDRRGNINTTVIGDYARPAVRLPGAGGAPEIAASSRRLVITLRHNPRSLVDRLDFVTSVGHGHPATDRGRLGLPGGGPQTIITDLGVLCYNEELGEFVLGAHHPGVRVEDIRAATGWPLVVADNLTETVPPTEEELVELRRFSRTSPARPVQ